MALEAGEPPALLKENKILLRPVPLPADELQTRLDLLCVVCKRRMENETVRAFAKKPLLLVQDLARQGFEAAMMTLAFYHDTIMLAPDAAHRDKNVRFWYDVAAERGVADGLVSSIRAGFFGPVYMGSAPAAITRIMAAQLPDAETAADIHGVLGSLTRPVNVPGELATRSDELLLRAAHLGNPQDLCRTIRAEIIWDDDSAEKGYPDKTLLDDKSLARDPLVRFTRGQTIFNYPGQHKEALVQSALRDIPAAADQGLAEASPG